MTSRTNYKFPALWKLCFIWLLLLTPTNAQLLNFVEARIDGTGLKESMAIAVSPDGANVYVAGGGLENTLAVFDRNLVTGAVSFVEIHRDNIEGVDGLAGANSVTMSPDGSNVYVASAADDALAVFNRDAGTGSLTFVEIEKDGVAGVDGLDYALSVIISPDGAHVYAAAEVDSAISVFDRDAGTGALTFVEVKKQGVDGVLGLDGVACVTISSDGKHLYTGAGSGHMTLFTRNMATGALTFVEFIFPGISSIGSITEAPGGTHIYASSGTHGIGVFSRDPITGELSLVEIHSDGGAVGSVIVSPDGAHLYANSPGNDAVAVFNRDAVTGVLTFTTIYQDGVGFVEGLALASSVTMSPDGKHVYVTGRDDDALAVFNRNAETGGLTFVEVLRDGEGGVDGLDGAISATVSPDGKHVYAGGASLVNSHNIFYGSAAVFARQLETGVLSFVEAKKDDLGRISGMDGPGTAVSPDGKNVYAAAYIQGDGGAVAVYGRDVATGTLTLVEVYRETNDGDDYVASNYAVVSPDGANVYTAGVLGVLVFSRDAATGHLSFVEMHRDAKYGGTIDGIYGASSVVPSPDGSNIYVACSNDNTVVAFRRSPSTGELSLVEVHKEGVAGVDGLAGANSVAVSPDGIHVYVTGFDDNAVTLFSRNPTTGALTYQTVYKDGVMFVDGLAGANSVAVSPFGLRVYATGADDDALAVFDRDKATGGLSFLEIHRDGVDSVYGLAGASSVAISPDGNHVYATGKYGDAVVVFDVDNLDFGDAPDPAYSTLAANNGARHRMVGGLYLGAGVDPDLDGQPHASALGDDGDGTDDEDGVLFTSQLLPGSVAALQVVASAAGFLDAWIDFNGDGDWADAGEQIFTSEALSAGTNSLGFTVPGTAVPNMTTVARFRFSSAGGLSFDGLASDGEVEDHQVAVAPMADLSITKNDGQTNAIPGSSITYTITVNNNGPNYVTGARVTDSFPAILTGTTWTCAGLLGGNCTAGGSGDLNDTVNLPVGGSVTYAVTGLVDPAATGTLDNTAMVTAPVGITDPALGNNNSTDSDSLTPETDLSVTKSDSPDPVSVGTDLTYTANVVNAGPSVATGVALTDSLPADVTFLGATTSQGSCSEAGGTVTCTIGTLASSGTATVIIIVTPTIAGTITNNVSVVGNEQDPDTSNNTATETTTVEPPPPTISIDDISVSEGDSGSVNAVFTVSLSASSNKVVSVDYATADETASASEDYESASGNLTIPAGQNHQSVTVTVYGDVLLESDETFWVELSNASGGVIVDGHGVGTIQDDDSCIGPNLLVNPGAEQKRARRRVWGWTQVLGRWGRSYGRATSPAPFEGNAYFDPGRAEAAELRQDVDVSAFREFIDVGGQEFVFDGYVRTRAEVPSDTARIVVEFRDSTNSVVLDAFDSGEISSAENWHGLQDQRTAPAGTGWIRVRLIATRYSGIRGRKNDAYFNALSLRSLRTPVLTMSDTEVTEPTSGSSPALFTVSVSCATSGDVAFDATTVDGTALALEDYEPVSLSGLTVPPGETAVTIPVLVFGDTQQEAVEYFFLRMDNVRNGVVLDSEGVGTITDSQGPRTPPQWLNQPGEWPVQEITLGGITYDQQALMQLLAYDGVDPSTRLARELAATKLNLASGTDPVIVPVADRADLFLKNFPTSRRLSGKRRLASRADNFRIRLLQYNSGQ